MRIVGGRLKGAQLQVTPGTDIRPTADRVREALFNMLEAGRFIGGVRGKRVVDVFAGSGAMGLEALSRGADRVTFLEINPRVTRTLEAAITRLRLADTARVVGADALRPPMASFAADLAFLDPPYRKGLAEPSLEALSAQGWLAPGALVLVEMEKTELVSAPDRFAHEEERRWGRTKVVFLRHSRGL